MSYQVTPFYSEFQCPCFASMNKFTLIQQLTDLDRPTVFEALQTVAAAELKNDFALVAFNDI